MAVLTSALLNCGLRLLIGLGVAAVGFLLAFAAALLVGPNAASAPMTVWWVCAYALAGWAIQAFVQIPYAGLPINLLLWAVLGLFANTLARDTGQSGHLLSYGLAALVCIPVALLSKVGAASNAAESDGNAASR